MKHPSQLRLAMAQINVVVGDIDGNTQKILEWMDRARDVDADIVMFPELALTGYPPEDLLLKPQFIDANLAALDKIVNRSRDIAAVIGFVDRQDDIFNAAAVVQNGKRVATYHKIYLPNYGVFDEFRYFQPGNRCPVLQMDRVTIGISICEDIWYPDGPVFQQALAGGAEVIINISSQMGHVGSTDRTVYVMTKHALEGLTKAMACELAAKGVRVVSLAPTAIETPMSKPYLDDPAFRKWALDRTPLGRIGTVEEVAQAAVFLASPAASLVTGSSLLVDGGWTAW